MPPTPFIFICLTMARTIRRGLPLSLKVFSKTFVIILLIFYNSRINPLLSSATAATTTATKENDGGDTIQHQDSKADSPWQRLPHQIFKQPPTSESPVPSVEIDCAIRHFALDFVLQKLPWSSIAQRQHIADALRLQECPLNISSTEERRESGTDTSIRNFEKQNVAQILRGRRSLQNSSQDNSNDKSAEETTVYLFVDPQNGKDRALGTQCDPFKTIPDALDFSRKLRSSPSNKRSKISIVLKGGRYHLTEPLRLDFRDSNLGIEAYDGEKPELSGGDSFSLTLSQTKENSSLYFAKLPKDKIHYNFTMLFLDRSNFGQDDVRLVWAREPNGHPERDLQPDGYARANGTTARRWPENGNGSTHFVIGKDGNAQRNSTYYPWHGEDKDPRGGGNWLHFGGFGNRSNR